MLYADLQSQADLLIDTICLGFPVGEKCFGRKNLGEKFFGGKKFGVKQIWGKTFWGKKFAGESFIVIGIQPSLRNLQSSSR